MNEFARFYVDLMGEWFKDIIEWLKTFFNLIIDAIWKNPIKYFTNVSNYSNSFTAISWILYAIAMVITLGFIALVIIKVCQLSARFFKFRAKEVEKEELLLEISNLKENIENLVYEKEKIMLLKMDSINKGGLSNLNGLVNENELFEAEITEDTQVENKDASSNRFTKLIAIDEKYKDVSAVVQMTVEDTLGLPQIVDRFVNYAASQSGLYYTKTVISRYFAAMATSKIIILEGISGTGKTSLPYCMSRFFNNQAAIVSVQPSWRDRAEIIGYLNEFTKKFNESDFLKSLYEVTYREDINFIVLDELNLARIEYYFAEFLSIMEMPDTSEWLIDIVPSQLPTDPKHLINGKLLVPQNVWFIGTANKDDSTFTITDKVYDRAVTIFLNNRATYFDAPYTESLNVSFDYIQKLFKEAGKEHSISLKNLENINKLDEFIQDNFKIAFGNRIMKQIRTFVPVFVACGNREVDGLDYMICTKILKKFESLNIAFLRKEIEGLINLIEKLYGKGQFPESIAYLKDLHKMSA